MILLDNRLTDLVRGYDRIAQADLRLQTEGRQRLLQTYAARRDQHASALQRYIEKIRALKPQLSVIAYIPIAMLVGGSLLIIVGMWMDVNLGTGFPVSLAGLALLGAGALGLALPALLWLWQVKLTQPATPAHPLQHDALSRLMPQWRAKLREFTTLPRDATRAFLEHLDALAVDAMYVLARVQLARDEVDVVALGARGIWVFALAGDSARWQRLATMVAQTLTARTPDEMRRFPVLKQIKGGVVTDPAAWDQEIVSAPIIAGLDDRAIFALLDALLDQHHEMDKTTATISMSAHATKMIRQAEARLRAWVKE